MKTSMMDLQTSTLTLSFWNMSRNGRKRSWDTKRWGEHLSLVIDHFRYRVHFEVVLAHHGEEDGEVVEVGEDLPDHRLQLDAEQNKTVSLQSRR